MIVENPLLGERYRLVEPLRDLGAGEVWRVTDERRAGAQLVAKFLQPVEHEVMAPGSLAAILALKALRHPAVPTTLAHGVAANRPWIVTDDTPGTSLGTLLDRARTAAQPLDLAMLRATFGDVASALSAAHTAALPLVHGALTPGSVIVLTKPSPRASCALLDLGIAPWLAPPGDASPRSARVLVAHAPEVHAGSPATVATDIFALGALLTELLALPATSGETLAAVSDARRRADVPAAVWRVIAQAMAPVAAQRHASVAALVSALEEAWKHEPAQPRSRLAAMLHEEGGGGAGSLLETAIPVQRGPSLAPSPTPARPSTPSPQPLAPLPLSVDGALPLPPIPVSSSVPSRLAQLVGAMPSEPNPWSTEVRLREVPVPAPLTPAETEETLVIAPTPAPRESGGDTWIATAPVAPPAPPSRVSALAALQIPMNVPDGTLVATVPVSTPPVPRVAPVPVMPPEAPPPALAVPSQKPLGVLALVAFVLVTLLVVAVKVL